MPCYRIEEELARMKKNQERRLHRKNAKIVKEGGTPLQLNRPIKPDTTVSIPQSVPLVLYWWRHGRDVVATVDKWVIWVSCHRSWTVYDSQILSQKPTGNARVGPNSTVAHLPLDQDLPLLPVLHLQLPPVEISDSEDQRLPRLHSDSQLPFRLHSPRVPLLRLVVTTRLQRPRLPVHQRSN